MRVEVEGINNEDVERGADAIMETGVGRSLQLRRVEARVLAEAVLVSKLLKEKENG